MAKTGKKTIAELRLDPQNKPLSDQDMDRVKGGKSSGARQSWIVRMCTTILPQ